MVLSKQKQEPSGQNLFPQAWTGTQQVVSALRTLWYSNFKTQELFLWGRSQRFES